MFTIHSFQLARKPGDENPFAESYLFKNLLTMASTKGFDRQESPRTVFCARILIGLEISRKQLFYA